MEYEVFSTEVGEYLADPSSGIATRNNTEETLDFYRHGTGAINGLVAAYLAVLLLGVMGNLLVIAVMSKSPRMRTVTLYFIMNLAITDLLVLVMCFPPTLISNAYVRKKYFPITHYTLR